MPIRSCAKRFPMHNSGYWVLETRFSAFQTTFFARLIATPITIQPTDAKSQELPAMKVNAYGLLGHNKSPKFVSFTTDNRQSRMAMPRMSHAP